MNGPNSDRYHSVKRLPEPSIGLVYGWEVYRIVRGIRCQLAICPTEDAARRVATLLDRDDEPSAPRGRELELTQEVAKLRRAIHWALGENWKHPGPAFRERRDGEGAFWWRTELRRRAFGDEFNSTSAAQPTPQAGAVSELGPFTIRIQYDAPTKTFVAEAPGDLMDGIMSQGRTHDEARAALASAIRLTDEARCKCISGLRAENSRLREKLEEARRVVSLAHKELDAIAGYSGAAGNWPLQDAASACTKFLSAPEPKGGGL